MMDKFDQKIRKMAQQEMKNTEVPAELKTEIDAMLDRFGDPVYTPEERRGFNLKPVFAVCVFAATAFFAWPYAMNGGNRMVTAMHDITDTTTYENTAVQDGAAQVETKSTAEAYTLQEVFLEDSDYLDQIRSLCSDSSLSESTECSFDENGDLVVYTEKGPWTVTKSAVESCLKEEYR